MNETSAVVTGAAMSRLCEVLKERSVLRGTFKLASGRISNYYIDCRRTTLDAEGANLVGTCILALLEREGLKPAAVGGLTMGADPIATSVSVLSWQQGRPIPAFLVRKGAKEHGTGRRVEGWLPEGQEVLIVEDVVTTGGSTLEAIGAVEEAGAKVGAIVAIIDREEGGTERLEKYRYFSLFRSKDLI
jgi:orotate phosphoribosyltransferase